MIVAFEGIDACGKETQVRMLEERARELHGMSTAVFSFPNYESTTGKAIKEMLQLPDGERNGLTLQALMTANRYECQKEIRDVHRIVDLVILDRYWLSGFVYGSADGLDQRWLLDVHWSLIQPNLWIVLDLPVEESFARRPVREDAYESNKHRLSIARDLYIEGSDIINYRYGMTRSIVLDATKSIEELHGEVAKNVGIIS